MSANPKLAIWLCAATAMALAGCGGGDEDKKSPQGDKPAGTTTEAATTRCQPGGEPKVKRVKRSRAPSFRLARDKTYTARVATSCGNFEIELDSKEAPRTGGSFVTLARKGFYDGLGFHRIVPSFVIQGGDPRGDGSGGPGYSVREAPPDDVVYSEGVVAMAKTATEPPGTSGSQFFVVTSDEVSLPPEYALLGKVTKGLGVVKQIELVPAGPDDRPVEPVVIEKITVRAK